MHKILICVAMAIGCTSNASAQNNQPSSNPKLLLSSNSITDIKISLAQCSGQWAYVTGGIRNGNLRFPDPQAAITAFSNQSNAALNASNKLSGGDSRRIAEDFYNSLTAKHKSFGEEFGKTPKAAEMAFNLAMTGSKSCFSYLERPEVAKLLY